MLGDITVDGRRIKALMQPNKNAFLFVLDRTNGKPVWPIEERAVAKSTVPGEVPSATQPFPTKPPVFDRQGISEADSSIHAGVEGKSAGDRQGLRVRSDVHAPNLGDWSPWRKEGRPSAARLVGFGKLEHRKRSILKRAFTTLCLRRWDPPRAASRSKRTPSTRWRTWKWSMLRQELKGCL